METKMTARTTTTDLGKIVLMPGGEYSPDKTYEERTFVLYQNSTYVALQTVTGIEPSNDLVNWQLMAKGFAGSETQIEGYVFVDNEEVIAPESDPALDADKLGGNLPEYYAPQHEISDSFSESKSYALGDYCIYLNALYRFTKAKEAGAWDGTAVVPVTLAQEIAANRDGIATINSNLKIGSITGQTYYTGSDGADANKINKYFTLCKGANLPDSNSFWFLQTIIFQIGADGFVERGKQIAYKYDGSQIYERHKAYDQNWTAWNEYATKGGLGEWGGYKIIKTGVTDLNNPPNAFIIQTTPNASIPGFPTGIGGNTVLALQLYPGRDTFSAQLAFGFNMDKIAIRRKYNSTTWTDWKYFTAS